MSTFETKMKKMYQIDLNSDLTKNLTWRVVAGLHYLDR